jgi:Fe-S cluster assembly protein SufD
VTLDEMTQLDNYTSEFEKARGLRPKGEPARLTRTREEALSGFLAQGFPTTRDEEWKFTSVAPIANAQFALADEPDKARPTADDKISLVGRTLSGSPDYLAISPFQLPDVFGAELVFVDGHYSAALSSVSALPSGSQVGNLSAFAAGHAGAIEQHFGHVAPFDRRAFVALNTAFFVDGAYINIPARTVVEKPIHVMFLSTGKWGRGGCFFFQVILSQVA